MYHLKSVCAELADRNQIENFPDAELRLFRARLFRLGWFEKIVPARLLFGSNTTIFGSREPFDLRLAAGRLVQRKSALL